MDALADLHVVTDFNGKYTSVGAGLTLVGGVSVVTTMQNQNGVRIDLHSTTRGADITIGAAGVDMVIKR